MNELFAATRHSLVAEAADRLYRAIVTGQLEQGARIDEAQIATVLQISRGPLREALAGLTERGLVVKSAHRGTFVVTLGLQDVDDICSLRAVLEQYAIGRIIERCEQVDMGPFTDLVARMEPAGRTPEAAAALAELDVQFHAMLVGAARDRWLAYAWSNLSPQIHMLLFQSYTLDPVARKGAGAEHRRLLEALAKRCSECAREALRESLAFTHEHLKSAYSSSPTGGDGARSDGPVQPIAEIVRLPSPR